ncbi:unnamed protein product [Lepeophtheirus salmonis]|uniref:(salmon louse) hypothetical protein n=1 Tax=Lepeophtheirus salmonis TaxID=72036 RepID=A0A7R8HDX7_LEPSM|nr:unnamed protein product [Lepeophtheirus salmonis]CAF3031436.1 unnamed protein product [Lepeophtheirus salmonis]
MHLLYIGIYVRLGIAKYPSKRYLPIMSPCFSRKVNAYFQILVLLFKAQPFALPASVDIDGGLQGISYVRLAVYVRLHLVGATHSLQTALETSMPNTPKSSAWLDFGLANTSNFSGVAVTGINTRFDQGEGLLCDLELPFNC